jgi:hypothetical protein
MLDLLGGPRVIWPSTVYADEHMTEIPIWERETQILPPMEGLARAGVLQDSDSRDRDTSPYGVTSRPTASPVFPLFPLRRIVGKRRNRRASA